MNTETAKSPIKILILEDCEEDLFFLLRKFHDSGYTVEHEQVWTREALKESLGRGAWDVVISDYSLPGFNGLDALAIVKGLADTPFILCSGVIGEEKAVAAMKAGAFDWVSKDNLGLLVPAVERALRDNHQRRLRKEAEDSLRESQQEQLRLAGQMQLLLQSTSQGIYGIDSEGRCTFINRAGAELLGYDEEELPGQDMHQLVHGRGNNHSLCDTEACPVLRSLKAGVQCHMDGEVFWRRDGAGIPVEYSSYPNRADGRMLGALVTFTDVTERKRVENQLRNSEAELRVIFDNAALGMALVDAEGCVLKSNRALQRMLGYSEREMPGMTFAQLTHPEDLPADQRLFCELMDGTRESYQVENRYFQKSGETVLARLTMSVVRDSANFPEYAIAMIEDITAKRKLA